jgi:hypothetical protein
MLKNWRLAGSTGSGMLHINGEMVSYGEYEVTVQGDDYTVFLTNVHTGERTRTTTFHNTDGDRGRTPGFIGVQAYANNTVAWRHIRIKP